MNAPEAPQASDDAAAKTPVPALTGPEAAQGASFHVSRIEVQDLPDGAQAGVANITATYKDQQLTLGQLRDIAAQVTQVLVEHGETLSYASIPPQKIQDGIVKLRIVKGRLESLTLGQNKSLVSDKVLRAYLRRAERHTGNLPALQDQLLLLSDLPGVGGVSPLLAAGQTAGGTAMTIETEAAPRADVIALADNAGSATTGRNRIGAQVSVNSPLGLGDRFQAIAYAAPDVLQFNHDGDRGRTTIGRVSYDLPVNASGTRVGAAVSRVDYTLGGRYRDMGLGHANVFSLYANQPLVRTRTRSLNLGATLDQKEMRDTFVGDRNKRSAQVLGVQISGDLRSALGSMPTVVQYQAGASYGRLHNPDRFYGARTNGRFLKTTQSVKVLQGVRPGVYVDLSANAQQTSRNLDGAEKMVLGGPNAVRAYSNDMVSADSGLVASATLNVAVPQVKGLTLQAFYDVAQAKVQKFNNRSTHVEMSGYGVGASYTVNKRAVINVSVARPNGHTNLGQRPSGQVWVSAAIRF
ncbi:MAG: ShlB/FhaC/HecB family hemolysin secretion/activation protein [Ralstonia sp.]|nr:MAG: ShlB/FhaC/HecB family hemolysin secretion/activation protein [Ralstonia sp.]